MHLFQNESARRNVRKFVYEAFRLYFTIDQLSADSLRIRLSRREPDENEQHWSQAARDFHGDAVHIKNASDGVQAFVGIICAALSGDYRAILIDEPEAFLHPPLARKLGYQLTTSLRPGGSLMASTHSPDFLIGCLQASPHVRVIRLEYNSGRSKGTIVDANELRKLFNTPLLRSANVISGMFHDGVVVTESDNDRSFYAEIYHRLTEHQDGAPSILFVNAQNKQTIRKIMGPLRDLGVPAAAIVDIDIIKEGGSNWTGWLDAAQIPSASRLSLGQHRSVIHELFLARGKEPKSGGIAQLDGDDRISGAEFLDRLDHYGIFTVREGELEAWLPHLGITSKKSAWTVEMLNALGSDPNSPDYVRPTDGDVWGFMRRIARWVSDSQRKGTR
jgi:hypothetical protein